MKNLTLETSGFSNKFCNFEFGFYIVYIKVVHPVCNVAHLLVVHFVDNFWGNSFYLSQMDRMLILWGFGIHHLDIVWLGEITDKPSIGIG